MNGNMHRIRREAGFRTAEEFARAFGLDEKDYAAFEKATDVVAGGDLAEVDGLLDSAGDLAELCRLSRSQVVGISPLSDEEINSAAWSLKSVLRFVEKASAGKRYVNPQVAGRIDPKGNIVLARFGNGDAVIFRGGSFKPFVAVSGYDEKTGEWSQGNYYATAGEAWDVADPNVIESWRTIWTREDIKAELEERGYMPTGRAVDKVVGDIRERGGSLADGSVEDGWDEITTSIHKLGDKGELGPELSCEEMEVARGLTGDWTLCETSDDGALGVVNIPSSAVEDVNSKVDLFEVAFDPYEGAVWKKTEVSIMRRAVDGVKRMHGVLSPAEVAYLFEGSPGRAAAMGDWAVNAERFKELTESHEMLTPAREAFIDGLDAPENEGISIEEPALDKGGEEL